MRRRAGRATGAGDDAVARCRALCTTVTVEDLVLVAGGRHARRAGVLIRAATVHQGHHVVRLAGGAIALISMAYVHHAGCPILG